MGKVVRCFGFVFIFILGPNLIAQEQESKEWQVDRLEKSKEIVRNSEREALKREVNLINIQIEKGEITIEQAEILKRSAAEKHAKNIENRLIIIDNKIALIQRNNYTPVQDTLKENRFSVVVGAGKRGLKILGNRNPVKYDIRTSNDMLLAIGFNNAIIEGANLRDSPYKVGSSGFVEVGWNWKTRILEHSNFWRIKYGLSLQWNKLNLKDNQYLVREGTNISLERFPIDLKKSKFRTTYMVLPVYLEFGPSKKLDRADRIRYLNNNQFKIGIGGFAGVNIETMQKLKYIEDGKKVKDKTKRDFETNDFMYGLGGYIGIGDLSLYAKYNLSPIFKNQDLKQNNISLGLRLDLD
ncbi:MAG: hypothetical protein R2814_03965 [Flavobacteriaceae bacterium]